ncbi:MAG TPA: methionyl-tRNA formyltransferase, partial [Thermoanaerobaculia bacterium]
ATLGAAALLPVLRDLETGGAVETVQDHERATTAKKIDKSEGEVRFDETTAAIYNRFRAFDPWPGIYVTSGGETIKLTEVRPAAESGTPRTVLSIEEDVVVATSDGAIRILEMQRPGKPRTPAGAVARGLGWRAGELLPS